MNKIKIILLLTFSVSIFSCSDEFLEQKDLFSVSSQSYYRNAKDIGEALTGAYSVLPVEKGETFPTLTAMVLSDDVLGGGDGAGDSWIRPVDKFEKNAREDLFGPLWRRYYEGILRVNSIIENIDQAVYDDEEQAKQDLGEAHFLRGYMYFTLAQFFGKVPLITTSVSGNEPRAEVDVLFAQIASDMKLAAELMPATSSNKLDPNREGHATKWAAESMIGRIWLYYTGTYEKEELPLVEEGSITKANAIAYIEDVINNSGHRLISDFPNLWAYTATGLKEETLLIIPDEDTVSVKSNAFKDAGRDGTGTTPYEWIYDTNDEYNPESVFALNFNTFGGNPIEDLPRSNHMILYCGLRTALGAVAAAPHANGWGWCTVHRALWDDFEDGDIRKYGSMFNVEDPTSAAYEGTVAPIFQAAKPKYDGFNVTGVFNKKYMPLQQQSDDNPGQFEALWIARGYSFAGGDFVNIRDLMLIRFADVLLMHSELTATADGMTLVRERAGLDPIAYTLPALKSERRHELAFEGLRYFDLVRWGDCESAFAALGTIKVADGGFGDDGSYPDDYAVTGWSEDKKFLPIPESQVRLSDGVLEQNPGWE
ncbi:MAG: RagB/SusD family nutrient uptake outer membrane protein [Salinivirgaceae bacterium]|jgi:hypothetical protein|nr:RagB/SusD family nutrient uptake outer membrane protein [Salinivirgaceae bacterium]